MDNSHFYNPDGGWGRLKMAVQGGSIIEIPSLGLASREQAQAFLAGIGFDWSNEVHREELERLRLRSLRFIEEELLGDELALRLPSEVADESDLPRLMVVASTAGGLLRAWCCALLRVMHVLRHCKNVLLERYGDAIREQILGPFERSISHSHRGPQLGTGDDAIPLVAVEVKRVKPLHSVALKLLRKPGAVATDIEDYVCVRLVTENRFDALLALDYLLQHQVLTLASLKPGRARNTLVDLAAFDTAITFLETESIVEPAARRAHLHRLVATGKADPIPTPQENNPHRHERYRALALTGRQLIRAADAAGEALFFFPYEIQLLDRDSYAANLHGDASYRRYKGRQREAARVRVLGTELLAEAEKRANEPRIEPKEEPETPEEQIELFPPALGNGTIADLLDQVADQLDRQRANVYRVEAYRAAAKVVRQHSESVQALALRDGRPGLETLPRVGKSLSAMIDEIAHSGRLRLAARLTGGDAPVELFTTIPGIGEELSSRIHHELDIDTLEDLEVAAYDGRLDRVAGFGPRRLDAVRRVLETLLHRSSRGASRRFEALRQAGAQIEIPTDASPMPNIDTLLDVDREYRERAVAGVLPTVAPRRNNPSGEAWLPVMHTERGKWRFNAMFSNTARAHLQGRTGDWVVLFFECDGIESQVTVVTEEKADLAGQRVVRGREAECAAHYQGLGDAV